MLGFDFLLRVGDSASVIVTMVLALVTLILFTNGTVVVCNGIGIRGSRYRVGSYLISLLVTFSVRMLSALVIFGLVERKPLVFVMDLSR